AIRAVAESALEISKSCLELRPNEIIPEEVLEQHISPFISPSSSDSSIINLEADEEMPESTLNVPHDSSHISRNYRRKSYEPTFFTKLTVLERVRAIEGS
ncbi:MAG: hypothetical protein ACXAB4_07350, partial [Candidatus Hodarchaeales archaeon]